MILIEKDVLKLTENNKLRGLFIILSNMYVVAFFKILFRSVNLLKKVKCFDTAVSWILTYKAMMVLF